ncbi:nuclear transport factor 2 family protein [Bordetella muralis]|uniref:nuclear transport factor 2 family protein n=1 Tax=Bordetella muralis TaxID=1649130 RepID=UPI0039EF89C4
MLTTEHLDAYLKAMENRDIEATKDHMAADVVLRSPIVPTPFEGKENVVRVLTQLLDTVDAFQPKLLLREGREFVSVFTIEFNEHILDGMDHMHLNNEGLIDRMTMVWRPLLSIVAVQQKLAPKLGGKAMVLVPAGSQTA